MPLKSDCYLFVTTCLAHWGIALMSRALTKEVGMLGIITHHYAADGSFTTCGEFLGSAYRCIRKVGPDYKYGPRREKFLRPKCSYNKDEVDCPKCIAVLKRTRYYCPYHGFVRAADVTFDERCAICGTIV